MTPEAFCIIIIHEVLCFDSKSVLTGVRDVQKKDEEFFFFFVLLKKLSFGQTWHLVNNSYIR